MITGKDQRLLLNKIEDNISVSYENLNEHIKNFENLLENINNLRQSMKILTNIDKLLPNHFNTELYKDGNDPKCYETRSDEISREDGKEINFFSYYAGLLDSHEFERFETGWVHLFLF